MSTGTRQSKKLAVERAAAKVLKTANARFELYLVDRHYGDEEAVLRDLISTGPASDLIRAVAQWRLAKRQSRRARK